MNNIMLFCIIAAILGGAIWYIITEKRKGTKCIGCPCAGSCSHDCNDKGQYSLERLKDKDS